MEMVLKSSILNFFCILISVAQKAMFRMAFHGSYGNVWNALMTIPEVMMGLN